MQTASHTFEIEVRLSGSIIPGAPARGPAYDHGGLPADPAEVADVEITDIGALTYKGNRQWSFASLLDGVDRKSEAFRQIEANILAIVGEEAAEALLEANDRWAA